MTKETKQKENKEGKKPVTFHADPELWHKMKIHAASQNKKSAQELLHEIMEEWLVEHPLLLKEE